MIGLDTLLQKAQDLEPLPASATRLASLVCRTNVEMSDIVQVVALDQALTARLLRVANSAASAARMPVRTVRDAVVRLGNATVLAVAVAGASRRNLKLAVPEYGLSEDQLWRHSVAAALASECLLPECHVVIPAETFTAALLHDFGKLVLARFLTPQLLSQLGRARVERGLPLQDAERDVLGIDHARLGGLIAQRWGLPERIGRGIQHHHIPDAAAGPVCDMVALANQAAKSVKDAPVPGESLGEDVTPSRERLGISEDAYAKALERIAARFAETLAAFSD
ncbi:MAG: HDOD domain-containing protein [Deltaproteobacteria bacterium]|nr:HDOD domain-containing protein [Deltaproteobacteria bacterium]